MVLLEVEKQFFMNVRIACNKDLNAKGKAVELTVYVNGKFVIK